MTKKKFFQQSTTYIILYMNLNMQRFPTIPKIGIFLLCNPVNIICYTTALYKNTHISPRTLYRTAIKISVNRRFCDRAVNANFVFDIFSGNTIRARMHNLFDRYITYTSSITIRKCFEIRYIYINGYNIYITVYTCIKVYSYCVIDI